MGMRLDMNIHHVDHEHTAKRLLHTNMSCGVENGNEVGYGWVVSSHLYYRKDDGVRRILVLFEYCEVFTQQLTGSSLNSLS